MVTISGSRSRRMLNHLMVDQRFCLHVYIRMLCPTVRLWVCAAYMHLFHLLSYSHRKTAFNTLWLMEDLACKLVSHSHSPSARCYNIPSSFQTAIRNIFLTGYNKYWFFLTAFYSSSSIGLYLLYHKYLAKRENINNFCKIAFHRVVFVQHFVLRFFSFFFWPVCG